MRNGFRSWCRGVALLGGAALLALPARGVFAEDACAGYQWDISAERSLFAGSAAPLAAGHDVGSAPAIGAARLYTLTLQPQSAVKFAATPARFRPEDATFAGLASFSVPAPGHYRVSVDTALWIDVVADGKLAPVVDYQGRSGCTAPRKIVEFDLTGASHVILQLSGASAPTIRLTITASPVRSL